MIKIQLELTLPWDQERLVRRFLRALKPAEPTSTPATIPATKRERPPKPAPHHPWHGVRDALLMEIYPVEPNIREIHRRILELPGPFVTLDALRTRANSLKLRRPTRAVPAAPEPERSRPEREPAHPAVTDRFKEPPQAPPAAPMPAPARPSVITPKVAQATMSDVKVAIGRATGDHFKRAAKIGIEPAAVSAATATEWARRHAPHALNQEKTVLDLDELNRCRIAVQLPPFIIDKPRGPEGKLPGDRDILPEGT